MSDARMFGTVTNTFSRLGVERNAILNYGKLLTGQVGRLAFSLVYFLVLANALSLGDFGLFATASAIGVTLSRLAAFGFVSPLYRTACQRPALVGTYSLGYLVALILSLLPIAIIAWVLHVAFLSEIATTTFALVLFSEVVLWRTAEVVIVVNNGLQRFARASVAVVLNTALRAIAALLFAYSASQELDAWAQYYACANGVMFVGTIAFLQPRQRLRWAARIWLARWRDAIGVASAEVLFYAQSELDKLLVLALGGNEVAGLYAIVMRLADLTAIPLRSMMTLIVQRIMRLRGLGSSWRTWAAFEAGIFAVSAGAMTVLAIALNWRPDALGENVATASAFVAVVVLLPGFRNLVEFHTEILYAFERTGERLYQLAVVGISKAALLALLLSKFDSFSNVAPWLNVAFAALYALSAVYTYRTLARTGFRTRPIAA